MEGDHQLRHQALVYDSDRELVESVAPYLHAGLDRGAPSIAVLNRRNWGYLREALGPAADQVSYTDCDEFYVHPVRALAAYDARLRRHAAAGDLPPVVVGELPWGPTEGEWQEWTGYEALLNRALAHHDAWVLCTYDARELPDRLIEAAYRTHPHVEAGERRSGAHYEPPEQLLRSLATRPSDGLALPELALTDDAGRFRELLGAALARASVPSQRALEMLLAATEVFDNACRHGGGPTSLSAGTVDGWFVCEVADRGAGLDDPLAGYLPPEQAAHHGSGLWVARQIVSRLELMPGAPGLRVRLWL